MPLKKYKIVKVKPGPIIFQGQSYDLSRINDKQAAALHKAGCRFVEPLPTAKPAKKSSAS